MRFRTGWVLLVTGQKVVSILDLVAAVAVLACLLPETGALPGIAAPAFPLANALWFTGGLGGAFLLLATGPKLLLGGSPSVLYALGFATLIGAAGALRFQTTGFKNLTLDWLVMALVVAGMLLLLRQPWLWGLVGGLWSGLLLGAWSSLALYAYFTTPTRLFSKFLLIQFLASVLAIVAALMNLRLRARP
jgi:hypothetical protein